MGRGSVFVDGSGRKVVDHDVECCEEGVHVEHEESVPFPPGLVGRPTLIRGHLPLKFRADYSHQAFIAEDTASM